MNKRKDSHFSESQLSERAQFRRSRIVGHHAKSFEDADDWDLEFWQAAGPEARLSALVALRNEVKIVDRAREISDGNR